MNKDFRPLKTIILAFYFFITYTLASSQNQDSVTFGPEFEFTSQELVELWETPSNYVATPGHMGFWVGKEILLAEEFARRIGEKCTLHDCYLKKTSHKHKEGESLVFFNNSDFWIRISYDPKVLEIQTKPMTLSDQTKYKDLIEDLVFSTAKDMGLFSTNEEAGHFNIGFFSLFQRDSKTLKRFLSFAYDIENFPELWLGGLGEFRVTAMPLSLKPSSVREGFSRSIFTLNEIESRLIAQKKRKIPHRTFEDYIFEFLSDFKRARVSPFRKKQRALLEAFHNQALNVNAILDVLRFKTQRHNGLLKNPNNGDVPGNEDPQTADGPIELRGVRAQKSFHEFQLLSQLFLLRFKHLESEDFPIVYLESGTKNPSDSDIKTAFFLYVVEAGGNYEEFKELLPKKIQRAALNPYVRNLYLPKQGAVASFSAPPKLPQGESDFLLLKKLLPKIITSENIHNLFLNLFDSWADSQEPNVWMVALLKELQNITLRFFSHNAPPSILYADFYFLVTKPKHALALYLTLLSKSGSYDVRAKNEMTRIFEKNSRIIAFDKEQSRLLTLSYCQDYFL